MSSALMLYTLFQNIVFISMKEIPKHCFILYWQLWWLLLFDLFFIIDWRFRYVTLEKILGNFQIFPQNRWFFQEKISLPKLLWTFSYNSCSVNQVYFLVFFKGGLLMGPTIQRNTLFAFFISIWFSKHTSCIYILFLLKLIII